MELFRQLADGQTDRLTDGHYYSLSRYRDWKLGILHQFYFQSWISGSHHRTTKSGILVENPITRVGIHDAELVAKDDQENEDDEDEDDGKWSHDDVLAVGVCHIYQWLIVILINDDKFRYCKDVIIVYHSV